MQCVRQKNTSAESALRPELHACGIHHHIQVSVLTKFCKVADVVFSGFRVAVFVDGCYRHGCSGHATWSNQNDEFSRAKIKAKIARDTDEPLRAEGWKVIRVWEHEEPKNAVGHIAYFLESRRERTIRA